MAQAQYCSTKECSQTGAAALDGQALCQEHFILASYRFLDDAAVQLRHTAHKGPATAALARRLDDCVRATTRLAMAVAEPNNLSRARLIDILLWAAELLKQVRRGPRAGMAVEVVLAGAADGETWEEKTKTLTVSRHGASLICARPLAQGEALKVTRVDTGQHCMARVVWSVHRDENVVEVGLELLNEQNLWGSDWDMPEAPLGGAGSGVQAD
jgi:hypothetical protein